MMKIQVSLSSSGVCRSSGVVGPIYFDDRNFRALGPRVKTMASSEGKNFLSFNDKNYGVVL